MGFAQNKREAKSGETKGKAYDAVISEAGRASYG